MTLGQQKLQSTYCLKNEQMQQNTPVSKRPRVLIVPKSAYQRLINYTTENKRRAAEKEKAEKKAADLKKAAYEASKNWDNTIENIRKRREADLLSRKKKNEEAGRRFLEEMTLKNAAEREKTIKEARKLLLYTKPLCRRINSALFTSETLRELDTQVEFRQLLREMDKTMNDKFVKFLRENSEKLENEEKIKNEDKMNANNFYAFQLRQQMEETKKMHDRKENMKKEFDKRELKRILRENKQLEEARIKKEASRKKELAESILSAIKEKRRLEAERRKREEFKDREIEILSKAKIKVNKLLKEIFKEEQQAVELRSQAVIEHHPIKLMEAKEKQIEENFQKAVKEKEAETLERMKAKKDHDEAMKKEIEKYRLEVEERKAREIQKQKEYGHWEMMQRFKKSEFDKNVELENKKKDLEQKMKYAKELDEIVAEKKANQEREKLFDEESEILQKTIVNENKRILEYAEEVLEESKGIRPLYPILKEIKKCKKEMGILIA